MKKLTMNEQIFLIAIWHLRDEAYGIRIREKIRELTGGSMLFGTIYNTLEYLKRKNYIRIQKPEDRSGDHYGKRIYYRITEDGLRALREAKRLHEALWNGISPTELEEKAK